MSQGFDPARIRALLFDLDGTLADTDDLYIRRLAALLARLLPAESASHIARRWLMASEGVANAAYATADRLGLDNLLGPFLTGLHALRGESPRDGLQPVSGVPEALRRLCAHYPLAIVTAREAHSTHAFLEAWSLSSYFQCVVTGRTCWRAKPHPAPVLWAAHRLGSPPSDCLMVGDTTVDIRAGRAAGAQTAGVLCGFGGVDELTAAGADLILTSTADLGAHLLPPDPNSSGVEHAPQEAI